MSSVMAIAFDFQARQDRQIPLDEARAACDLGQSCWIDLDANDRDTAERILRQLGVSEATIEEALADKVAGRCDFYEECIHAEVTATELKDGRITFSHVDLVIGERYLVTVRRGPVEFIELTKKNYKSFFNSFAQTLGFLLFEMWDHLIDGYRRGLHAVEDKVEVLQAQIFGKVDDEIFGDVADTTHDLLLLRRNILADRDVLNQLTTRRSKFIAETAVPHLHSMVGTLDQLGADLTVEREILAETLNLHLGIVSHRTNKVVNRLTVISSIFLPLTFLCGVYGMNFTYLPEKDWHYGYAFFWFMVIAISGGMVAVMKKNRWM
jgi:magnesium transporter